jgi:hypothetical protein
MDMRHKDSSLVLRQQADIGQPHDGAAPGVELHQHVAAAIRRVANTSVPGQASPSVGGGPPVPVSVTSIQGTAKAAFAARPAARAASDVRSGVKYRTAFTVRLSGGAWLMAPGKNYCTASRYLPARRNGGAQQGNRRQNS